TRVAGHRSFDPALIDPSTPFVIVVLSYFVSAQPFRISRGALDHGGADGCALPPTRGARLLPQSSARHRKASRGRNKGEFNLLPSPINVMNIDAD
ncbi:MAG: hypothetical protein NUW01_19525, partial [Gemmatimonadaceae bacterium]|nr:hypothetical protein [Gemmatimonadaceae bacterium]